MYMYPEFNCLYKLIMDTYINKMAAMDHVLEIERQIQVIKERMCARHSGIPYNRMTRWMVIGLGKYSVMMINALPPKIGISRTYIPHTIMTYKQLDFKKQCRRPSGAYVQSHDNRKVTNKMIDHTQGTIYLGPTGNPQGTYAFLLICTRRKITRRQFTEMPTPLCVN